MGYTGEQSVKLDSVVWQVQKTTIAQDIFMAMRKLKIVERILELS